MDVIEAIAKEAENSKKCVFTIVGLALLAELVKAQIFIAYGSAVWKVAGSTRATERAVFRYRFLGL